MLNYLVQRLATIVPTLFFVSILIFGLQQLLPGDPALILAGEDRDPTVIAHLRSTLHLDDPLPVRYAYWAGGVLKGDLGESQRIKKPVLDLIVEKLPVTLELACIAIVIALSIGVTAGIVVGDRQGHRLGLRRQHLRAVGTVHAQLLAGHHADPAASRSRWAGCRRRATSVRSRT